MLYVLKYRRITPCGVESGIVEIFIEAKSAEEAFDLARERLTKIREEERRGKISIRAEGLWARQENLVGKVEC